jgi:hypothetical protein
VLLIGAFYDRAAQSSRGYDADRYHDCDDAGVSFAATIGMAGDDGAGADAAVDAAAAGLERECV